MENTIRILMLEDSENNAKLYIRILQKSGLKVESKRLEKTEDIWPALRELKPHIVLCNLMLQKIPVSDIIIFIKELKKKVPFIVFAENDFNQFKDQLLVAGVSAYLTKEQLDDLGI